MLNFETNCEDTFMCHVLAGDVVDPENQIDDWIDRWHEDEFEQLSKVSLHAFLGMTQEEYSLFVERPELLRSIIIARQQNLTLSKFQVLQYDIPSKLFVLSSMIFVGGSLGWALGADYAFVSAIFSGVLGWILGSLYAEVN
jgi:hypothetical protein